MNNSSTMIPVLMEKLEEGEVAKCKLFAIKAMIEYGTEYCSDPIKQILGIPLESKGTE